MIFSFVNSVRAVGKILKSKMENVKKINKIDVGVVIPAHNEAKMIGGCLESLKGFEEIVVIDIGSTDETTQIAAAHGVKVVRVSWKGFDYAFPRNKAREIIKNDWILYIDADERLTPSLKQEILNVIKNPLNKCVACAIPRQNFILGKEFHHSGQWPDYVIRLFKQDKFNGWQGKLHEQASFDGQLGHLKNPLIHQKHETIAEMVEKTNNWSDIEAKLLFDSNHPKMSWWRFIRIMLTEIISQIVVKKAFLDGPEGIVYAFYQMWSRFLTYAKLWEMQQK